MDRQPWEVDHGRHACDEGGIFWGVLALFPSVPLQRVEPLSTKVDYMETVVAAKRAVEAGREGKHDLLIQFTEEALKHAREQSKIRTMAAAQRITEP